MDVKLGAVEFRFAEIIWANEPLHSRELVELCQKELNWNRSTTSTVRNSSPGRASGSWRRPSRGPCPPSSPPSSSAIPFPGRMQRKSAG